MEQPGREVSAPWDGSESNGDSTGSSSPSAAPQPIVLSGSEGLSLNTQMQGEMPSQLTPSSGATLTGSVGTIESSVWSAQAQSASQGSMLKGVGITCMFGLVMMLVPMLIFAYAENSWEDDWGLETLNVDWDEARLNGSFQLSNNAPIEHCSINIYDGNRPWGPDSFYFQVYEDCSKYDYSGTSILIQAKQVTRTEFMVGEGEVTRVEYDVINASTGEARFTVNALDYEGANDSVTLHFPAASPPGIGVRTFDENMSPLIFTVNTTNWADPCSTDDLMVIDVSSSQNYDPIILEYIDGCHLSYSDYHHEFTFIAGLEDKVNDSVSLYLPEQGNYFLGTQTIDENMTPLIFPVYTNNWDENYCSQDLRIDVTDQGSDWYYPDYKQWGQPPICPEMTYYVNYETTFGSIDLETGFGQIYLDEPLTDKNNQQMLLEIEYFTHSEEDFEFEELAGCFASLFSLVLFVVWIMQVVRAFQAGLTNQGTGLLVGIIPAIIVAVITAFIITVIMFGF